MFTDRAVIDFCRLVATSDTLTPDIRKQAIDIICGVNVSSVIIDGKEVAISDRDLAQVQVEILAHRKIPAIKLLRNLTGCGLKEGKDAIESQRNFKQYQPPVVVRTDDGTGGTSETHETPERFSPHPLHNLGDD